MAIVLPKISRRRAPAGHASEAQPAVNLTLCREDACYEAGSRLRVKWRVGRVPANEIDGMEVSVLWYTEGKGDEDFRVHHFCRLEGQDQGGPSFDQDQSTECVLPLSPLSYRGQLISLQWCVRIRIFLSSGREIVTERPFHLVGSSGDRAVGDDVVLRPAMKSAPAPRSPSVATDQSIASEQSVASESGADPSRRPMAT